MNSNLVKEITCWIGELFRTKTSTNITVCFVDIIIQYIEAIAWKTE